jgi:hypothetical protein
LLQANDSGPKADGSLVDVAFGPLSFALGDDPGE